MKDIQFSFSRNVEYRMIEALKEHSHNEIGGILIGRKLDLNSILIVDLTVSDEIKKFSPFKFIRETKKSNKLIKKHFKNSTGYYVGEWHSHPSFSLNPSPGDIRTMKGIIKNTDYGVAFSLMIIVKLRQNELALKGYLFHKDRSDYIVLS